MNPGPWHVVIQGRPSPRFALVMGPNGALGSAELSAVIWPGREPELSWAIRWLPSRTLWDPGFLKYYGGVPPVRYVEELNVPLDGHAREIIWSGVN